MTNIATVADEAYLIRRVREETRAALRANDPKASAAHVELATRYLTTLNNAAGPPERNPSPRA